MNAPNTNRLQRLALALALPFLAGGCQILGIASYRNDSPQHVSTEDALNYSDCSDFASDDPFAAAAGEVYPSLLPPLPPLILPDWLARHHFIKRKEKLPEPPPHPRFHPLPTRPMFAPKL